MKPELLAPAGNMESLKAAIQAGCDAVYLGGYAFGARSFAGNFSNEEIKEAIEYAHIYGVRVYVTVNTLVYENEVEMFLNYIDFLHKNNVDAIIIQDLGMLDLVRKTYPNLEIHASTQMHIHNMNGVKLAKKLGIKRVVLARETNIDTIKQIKKEVDIELEVFIHGALCVSYSGQCLMSSLIGNRSGNRGSCAQCCRQPYSLISNNKKINNEDYLLSMKDLNTLEHLEELLSANVDSLKIEGRMKRPEYVYLVVSIYRKSIDNYYAHKNLIDKNDIIELKKIFNREFTKGFLFNENNNSITNEFRPNHMGINIGKVIKTYKNKIAIKLTENINKGDGIRILDNDYGLTLNNFYLNNKLVNSANKGDVIEISVKDHINLNSKVVKTTDIKQLENIENILKNKNRYVNIKGKLTIKNNQKMTLEVSDGVNDLIINSNYIPELALKTATSKERVIEQMNKLKDTPYLFTKLDINMDGNLFINIKEINELRRKMILELNNKRMYKIPYIKSQYNIDIPDFKKENVYTCYIDTINTYNKLDKNKYKEIYVPLEIHQKLKNETILKLPRVINKNNNYDELIVIGELGSINNNCYTDFSFNVTNSYAVAFLHSLGVKKVTLSLELEDNQIKELINNYKKRYNKHPNLELIVYGNSETMITKLDLLKKYNLRDGYLQDRFNNQYKLKSYDDFMIIYDYKCRNLKNIKEYFGMGINSLRYDFID